MSFQYLGTITKTHGIQGDCILADIDFLPTIKSNTAVKLGFSESFAQEYTLESCRPYRLGALLHFKGINSISAAEALLEKGVFIERRHLESAEASQFSDALEGYEVRDALTNERKGSVVEIFQSPAHRTIVVQTADDDEVLIPHVPAIVSRIDEVTKVIFITAPEGLFELDALESVDNEEDVELESDEADSEEDDGSEEQQ